MMAAGQASLGLSSLPASVIQELLTKYKFISTSGVTEANHRNGHSFVWQEKDSPLRLLPVECGGFAENGGTVYVCGEILSMISEDLKLNIERNQRIKFDCSIETFDTVMTFLHSANGTLPSNDFLLTLLPMLHDCQLPFLADVCAYCIIPSQALLSEALTVAFRAENDLLLQCVLKVLSSRRQLQQLIDRCQAFRDVRKTGFAGEALGRMMELMAILPEERTAPGFPANPRRVAFNATLNASSLFRRNFQKYRPSFRLPTQTRDFPVTVDQNYYVSRPVMAHASRFFHQLFYGDFVEQGLESFAVEGASAAELRVLLELVFPTAAGMLRRLTPNAEVDDPTKRRVFLLASVYTCAFHNDPLKFVNVFKLAEYYQFTGVIDYLTDVAVHCLPWHQRLQLADMFKSREIMASLLTDDSLKELKKEMAACATVLDEFSLPTKNLIIDFFLHATNF